MKTTLEQLESWIEQFYKINGTPTLDDIKGQINLLKDYETEQLAIPRVSNCLPTKEEFSSELENHQNKWSKSHSKITNNAYALGFRHCFHYMSNWVKQHR